MEEKILIIEKYGIKDNYTPLHPSIYIYKEEMVSESILNWL